MRVSAPPSLLLPDPASRWYEVSSADGVGERAEDADELKATKDAAAAFEVSLTSGPKVWIGES